MMLDKPYSEACDENRAPIFAALAPRLAGCTTLLEIGSGTGQHAVYFAAELPQLVADIDGDGDLERNRLRIRNCRQARCGLRLLATNDC